PRLHRPPYPLRLPALLGPAGEPLAVARRHDRRHGQLRVHHRALPRGGPRDAHAAPPLRRGHAHRDAARRYRVGVGGLRGLPGCARGARRGPERRRLHRPLGGPLPRHGPRRGRARSDAGGVRRDGGPRPRGHGRGRRRLFADAGFRAELCRQAGSGAALAQGWDRLALRRAAGERVRRGQNGRVAVIDRAGGRAPLDVFCDLVLEDDLATQWGVVLMNYDERAVAELIRHPAGLLALSDAGAHVDTLCDQGFTTYLLGHWVRDLGALPLEQAVRLVTAV